MPSSDSYSEYITTEGDRPDNIAYRFYGSQYEYPRILFANPSIMNTPILTGGITLRIPDVGETEIVSSDRLPPWKR